MYLPRLDFDEKSGEIFALWQPIFDGVSTIIGSEYLTDANGFQLIKRKVYNNIGPVSSSFYPVTSLISSCDSKKENALTIWNDRPQAGSVHQDGGMKLLIDRRVKTNDSGGIPEKM